MSQINSTTINTEFINAYVEPTTISRRELFDETNYKKIMDNQMLDKLTQKRMTKYFKDRQEPGVKNVTYSVGKNNIIKAENNDLSQIGRIYPDNGMSGMRRDVRNALAERFYWDLDLVNAHYYIALHLCENVYNIRCDNMRSYVENREEWLNKIHPDRKVSKTLFLMIAFGGSVKNYDEEYEDVKDDFEKSNEVNNFLPILKQEFNGLASAIWADSKYENIKKIKCGKDNIPLKDQSNSMFKLLSKVLQHIEKKLLLFLSAYLEMRGRYMGVYIHDGGFVEKLQGEKEFNNDLRIECENAINYKFSMIMKLSIKKIEYTISDFSQVNNLENEILELEKIDGYQAVKEEFEKINFFINDITSCAEIKEKDEYYELIIREKSKLFDRYAPMIYKEYIIKDWEIKVEEKPFIQKWFKDDERRQYSKIDFLPNRKHGEETFNTFKMLKGEALCLKYPEITKEYVQNINNNEIDDLTNEDYVNFKELSSHIADLAGNDEKMYLYFIQWLAFVVQKRIQPQTALVFQSKEGTGKDLFWGFVYKYIIGKNMVAIPSKLKDICGTFNGTMIENKLMAHINEVSGKDSFAENDYIKQLIAGQETIKIENKNENGRNVTNNLSFIFLSNNENAVKVNESDRRWVVFECSNKWVEVPNKERFEHFNKLSNILSNDEVKAERLSTMFYLFLQNIDLSNFDVKDRPISNLYNEMKKAQLPIIYYWFKSIYEVMEEKGDKMIKIKGNDLYTQFNEWKTFSGHSKYEMTLTKFGIKIKDFNFIEKKRSGGGICYEVKRDSLIEFLKSKDLYDDIFSDE